MAPAHLWDGSKIWMLSRMAELRAALSDDRFSKVRSCCAIVRPAALQPAHKSPPTDTPAPLTSLQVRTHQGFPELVEGERRRGCEGD